MNLLTKNVKMSLRLTGLALISSVLIIGCNDNESNKKNSLTVHQGLPKKASPSEETNKQEKIKTASSTYKQTSIPSIDGKSQFDVTSVGNEYIFNFSLTDKKILKLLLNEDESDSHKGYEVGSDGQIKEVENKDAGKSIISMALFTGDTPEQITDWIILENIEERAIIEKKRSKSGKLYEVIKPVAFTFKVTFSSPEDMEIIRENLGTMKMIISNGEEPSKNKTLKSIDFESLCEAHPSNFFHYENKTEGCEAL